MVHPTIDACVQLRNEHGIRADDVLRIDLRVHSLVLELCGKKAPKDGLEGKFSVYHGAAAGLIFGQAGEPEYADDIVNRADMVAVRGKIVAVVDDAIHEASVDVTVTCHDGRSVHLFVEHAIGSVERPMSNAQLEAKFDGMVHPVLGAAKADEIKKLCWALSTQNNVSALTAAARP